MKLREQALKGLVWSSIDKWGAKIFALLVFVILARLLEPEAFGLIAISSVFVQLINVLVDQGFSDAIVQREKVEKEHLDTAFWSSIVLSIVLFLLIFFSSGIIADLMGEIELSSVLKVLSLAIIVRAFSSVQIALFRRDLKFKILSIRSLASVFIGGIVGIFMAYMGYGVWSIVGQQLISKLTELLVLWLASDWRPSLCFSIPHFKELFSFGVNILFTNLLNFGNRNVDDLLIGYFLGSTALGYYTVAYNILKALTDMIASVGYQVAFPTFSKIQKQPEKIRQAFYEVTEIASFVSFPIFIGVAAVASNLIPVVFGDQWDSSIPVMQVLALIGVLHTLYYFNNSVILALGKSSWRLGINLVNVICNIFAFIIAVQWGIFAVAVAYVLRGYVLSPIPLLLVRKLIGFNMLKYFKQMMFPFVGALSIVFGVYLCEIILSEHVSIAVLLAIQIITGFLVYILTHYAFNHQFLMRLYGLRSFLNINDR